jgi:hypothetical protein
VAAVVQVAQEAEATQEDHKPDIREMREVQ